MVNRCVTLLFIGAVSEPKLSVVPSESGGVTLHCEATCWLPEPEIQFLDHQGNNITADNENRTQDASGCYTVTRRVTLQDATHRFTFTSSFKLRLIFYKRPFVAPSLKLSCLIKHIQEGLVSVPHLRPLVHQHHLSLIPRKTMERGDAVWMQPLDFRR